MNIFHSICQIVCGSNLKLIYFLPPQLEDFSETLEDFLQGVADVVDDQFHVATVNVFIVAPSPRLVGFRYKYLQVVFFVQLDNGTVVLADLLAEAVNENGMALAEQVCNS